MFFDRNNMSFLFVTGNQKTLPGYFCSPASADPACAASGLTPVVVPFINSTAATGGWQLGGLPGYPGTPANVLAEITTSILGARSEMPDCPMPNKPACRLSINSERASRWKWGISLSGLTNSSGAITSTYRVRSAPASRTIPAMLRDGSIPAVHSRLARDRRRSVRLD